MRKNSKKSPLPLAEPISKQEPAYININEHGAEIAAKSRLLWIIVIIFSIILAIFWLVTLKFNIQKATSDIGFSQIGKQIADSLARFDTEIKNRSTSTPISADDLAAIKTGLEKRIKNNPDSSLWPTHELATLNISLQYPDNWKKSGQAKEITLTDAASTTAEYGRIIISAKSAAQKSDPYVSSSARQLDETVYFNSTSSKTFLEIKMIATGDISYYRPLMEEIVRTIKVIK